MTYVEIIEGFPQCTSNGTQEYRKGWVKITNGRKWKPRLIVSIKSNDNVSFIEGINHEESPGPEDRIITWKYYTFDDPYTKPPKPEVSEHDELIGFVVNLGPGWVVKYSASNSMPLTAHAYAGGQDAYTFAKYAPEGVLLTEWKTMKEWKEEWKNESKQD